MEIAICIKDYQCGVSSGPCRAPQSVEHRHYRHYETLPLVRTELRVAQSSAHLRKL